jgi:hypothetical protein
MVRLNTAVMCRGVMKEFLRGENRSLVLRGVDLEVPLAR